VRQLTPTAGGEERFFVISGPLAAPSDGGAKPWTCCAVAYYYRSARTLELIDGELTAIIEDVQDKLPCYGYRRVSHELRRRGRHDQ